MEASLSTLIAFVGFLIVFSMLIQSLQEALKNLFKLRTGVWERFFISLYRTEFQLKGAKHLTSTPFAERVMRGAFLGEFEQRLKQIKNVVQQTDTLIDEIRINLSHIIGAEKEGTTPAPEILDSVLEKASQITALKLDSTLKIYNNSKHGAVASDLQRFKTFVRELQLLQEKKEGGCGQFCTALLDITSKLKKNIAPYRVQIENKADAWPVQLEGEYKKNMLKWTLVISLFAVVMLNADACRIYNHFALNPSARQAMEASAITVAKINKSNAENLNGIEKQNTDGNLEQAREQAQKFAEAIAEDFKTIKQTELQDEAAELAESINSMKIKPSGEDNDPELDQKIVELDRLYFKLLKLNIEQHTKTMEAIGLPLGWGADFKIFQALDMSSTEGFTWILKKVCGLALTLFLVSFGAPFWKEIMNALVGVREMVRSSKK